jgi:hypothetical protein
MVLFVSAACVSEAPAQPLPNTCIAGKPTKIVGSLCGRVIDPTGAFVPGLELIASDSKTNAKVWRGQSDDAGNFWSSKLPAGQYTLTTSKPGWRSYIGQFVISRAGDGRCQQPVAAGVAVGSCEGGVSKQKLHNFSKKGPSRPDSISTTKDQ